MSAERLREAARVLREASGRATPGRWKLWGMSVMADQDGTSNVATAVDVAHTAYRDEHDKPRTFDAEYIRLTQPEVGGAIADWLERVAVDGDNGYDSSDDNYRHANAVADAILGGQS